MILIKLGMQALLIINDLWSFNIWNFCTIFWYLKIRKKIRILNILIFHLIFFLNCWIISIDTVVLWKLLLLGYYCCTRLLLLYSGIIEYLSSWALRHIHWLTLRILVDAVRYHHPYVETGEVLSYIGNILRGVSDWDGGRVARGRRSLLFQGM